jgi:Cyclic-phosphate processing Receiver domain
MKRLFLDDIRMPEQAYLYTKNPVFLKKWDIVRTYEQFVEYITKNGIPDLIAFDHDLADDHYVKFLNSHLVDYDYDKDFKEKTGYHCAKWLTDYMLDNDIRKMPEYLVHSMNPAGRQNIKGLLSNFKKFLKENP